MVFLTVGQMYGPTPEAKAAQHRQMVLLDAYYDVANAFKFENAPAVAIARNAYKESVRVLEGILGPEAHCNFVDCELWQEYSDMHKYTVGFRPGGHLTRKQTLDWCLLNRNTDVDDY